MYFHIDTDKGENMKTKEEITIKEGKKKQKTNTASNIIMSIH